MIIHLLIIISLNLSETQRDVLEILSYLSNKIFIELYNKRLLNFKLEYNFITLQSEIIHKLLQDQMN